MKNIHVFFNEFRLNAGAIWLENGSINLSVPKKFQNQDTKDFIVNNKNQIISILNENQIFSIEKFLNVKILRDNTITHYPLSPSQERLWFIEQYEEGTNAFHIPELYELDANTDVEGLKYALQQIVSRHEVLRSTIELGEDQVPYQIVHANPIEIQEITLTNSEDLFSVIKEDINRPFDFSREYPIRVKFYHTQLIDKVTEKPSKRTLLLVNIHHIAGDGWSIDIFQSELFAYYEAYINKDTDFRLPDLEIQYKDYAIWQRAYLTGETLEKQLSYWKSKLLGYQDLELPTDYARPSKVDNKGSEEKFTLDKATSHKLRAFAQRQGVTLHSVMLGSIGVLLSKYTGQDDIVVGSPIANRHHRQTEKLIGFFINTQVNRVLLNNAQSFEDLVRQVHQDQIEAQLNQDLPIDDLIVALGVERDSSKNNIFQVYFVVQNFGNQDKTSDQQKKYLKLVQEKYFYEVEKFDLSITIDDGNEEIMGEVSYATSLFHRDTIVRLIHQYKHLLAQLAKAPEKSYGQLSLLNTEEYNQIIYQWNETDKDYPKDKTIYQLFQEQVVKTPDNIAVVYEQQRLTYRELDEKSNQLAWYIRTQYQQRTKQTLKADTLIVLYLDRSLEMIIGILGVLKAGGAYVPMDPVYPQERVDYILENTKAELILSQKHLIGDSHAQLPQEKIIHIDLTEELYNKENKSNLPQFSKSTDLAYIIYTSGTTGNPKGVMVEHSGVNNEILSQLELIPLAPSDKSLLTANIIFDAAAECIYMSLFSGGSLYILGGKSILDSEFIKDYIESSEISVFNTTPSYLNSLGINLFSPNVKYIILGGEAYQKVESSAKVYNTYGPTETTIVSTGGEVDYKQKIHIGKPINNTRVYVLDQNKTPVPIGVIGELYIGGAGVSRGYFKLPDLTEERFVSNPFATESDIAKGYTRLYKTGDLVRWLPNGNIDFIARNDDQIKIRGYRIELGEIENAFAQISGIKQNCVLAKERKTEAGNSRYLAAYYVLNNSDATLNQTVIKEKLSQMLPEYMVPSALIAMETFPLTINGKLDKRALPEPDFSLSSEEYFAPTTEIEKEICRIWQEVLGLDRVGITDEFFRIGGDSILSIQVSSRIRQSGYYCHVKDIFECKTIERLAEHLMKKSSEVSIKSEQGVLTGELGLLPIQQWFLESVESGELAQPNHWNQSFLIRVPVLETNKLEAAIKNIVSYHDVLRIQFIREQAHQNSKIFWKQVYKSSIEIPKIKTLDVSQHTDTEIREILTEWQSNFNLEQGRLFQVGYLYGYKDGSARIYFALHHIIVDAVSWRILTEDIKTLYDGKPLPQKGSSYRQWIESVRNYTHQHPSEGVYWEDQLKNMPDYHVANQDTKSCLEFLELDKVLTKLLLQKAPNAYHTEINDLLLTALAYALKDINQNNIQGITLEGHGRENIDPAIDHNRTVGWFTCMFPVKLELQSNIKESIQFIKERLRSIPNRGVGFGSFANDKQNQYTHKDLAPISFNYLGQFDAQEGDWQIAAENSGKSIHVTNIDHNLITINGRIRNSSLQFYIAARLGQDTTRQLSDSFRTHLTSIIQHCSEKVDNEGTGYTPSDFNSIRISQSLLDRLQSEAQKYEK